MCIRRVVVLWCGYNLILTDSDVMRLLYLVLVLCPVWVYAQVSKNNEAGLLEGLFKGPAFVFMLMLFVCAMAYLAWDARIKLKTFFVASGVVVLLYLVSRLIILELI